MAETCLAQSLSILINLSEPKIMKIAIIGAGISGLSAAYYLRSNHQITVFEEQGSIGGHTATVDVQVDGERHAIDTGFIVYNDWTYPNFISLLDELGVESKPTEMSFSVRCDSTGLEYSGSDINGLFAQRRNILRPSFYGMLKDIMRFNRESIEDLQKGEIDDDISLGKYLTLGGYGEEFINRYLIPMGCAIWSASTARMIDFPLKFFIQFFNNHGLLSINNRPQWRVIKKGSRSYLPPLVENFRDRIVTNSQIEAVRRRQQGVSVIMRNGEKMDFDHVVFACHSDQAYALLQDATESEKTFLSSIPYSDNEVVLHTDESLLPDTRRAWASWNYWLREGDQQKPVLTYNMNLLQRIESKKTFCVTLNASDAIDPDKIIGRYQYSHPVFSAQSVEAVANFQEINGLSNTWFAGAYMGNGFHEDGVSSGKRVADAINQIGKVVNFSGKFAESREVANA